MNIPSKRLITGCLSAVALLSTTVPAHAEIIFGMRDKCSGSTDGFRDFSRQGRFFATSDYADIGNDWGVLTRTRAITTPGRFPGYNQPWTSNGGRTLFGVQFDNSITPIYPGQFGPATNSVPLFTQAVIQWKENVPEPSTWAACIRTPEGQLIKLAVDSKKPIYPLDRTTINFEPTAIKTFYVGLKGREDGIVNYADVVDLKLKIAPERSSLTNYMVVFHPAFYLAVLNPTEPGMIEGLTPMNAFSASHHTLFYHGQQTFDLFFRMTPFIDYKGTTLFAVKKEYPVTTETTEDADTAAYTLSFDVPGEKPVELAVKSVFRTSAENALEFDFRANALPEGARIGYQFNGPASIFGALADTLPTASGQPFACVTPAGKLQFQVRGGSDIAVARQPGRKIGWNLKDEPIKFTTLSSGKDLSLMFSLPIGSAGQPQPEVLNYTWRPSQVGEGDRGLAPFQLSDLELLEEIDCGNPNDPHPYFDSSNDPVIGTLKKRFGELRERGGQHGPHGIYGYLAFLKNPQDGAIPIKTVAGQSCRAIPDNFGIYFRYNLQTKIQPHIAYLVTVEHAFDQLRRGEFHSIYLDKDDNLVNGSLLSGGIETSAVGGDGFRTESFLCYTLTKRWPEESTSSLVFSGVYSDGASWEPAPGPAIKTIRIYRVKTMPALPDLAPLMPPAEQRRSFTCLTELCNSPGPMWLFQYAKLVGYDGIWTYNDPISAFMGGSSDTKWGTWVHPGMLAGNRQLFAAAEEQGLFVNMHLSGLISMGFGPGDDDSFTGSFHHSYSGENVPFKPTRAERAHIAKALSKSLPTLAKYRSLRDIALADNIQVPCVWSERNMRDFCADTGAKLTPSPLFLENAHAILDGGPELVRRWMEWSCAERFKFHKWLLAEVRQYRPDLYLTLSRTWYNGMIGTFESRQSDPIMGVTRERLAELGVTNYFEFLKFMGINPDLYAGQPGFSMEIDSNMRIRPPDKLHPRFYGTDWFNKMKDDFKTQGLSIMANYCYEEHSKPLRAYSTIFAASQQRFRKGLVEAMLFGNPRNITLPTYTEPWSGHLQDVREFTVPYRLLPYTTPELFSGKVSDSASQALVHRYGNRYALFNAGDKETTVELELPVGCTSVTDLSSGVLNVLKIVQTGEKHIATVAMPPWSLKALDIK